MPKFTVIIPTTAHRETIAWAIASVLDQTQSDLRLHVIGDGCPDRTAEIVGAIGDERVVLHRFPKAAGTGEEYRDQIIRAEESDFVAYLPDDDLWTVDHLAVMEERLAACDFCHSHFAHIGIDAAIAFVPGNLNDPAVVRRMLAPVRWNAVALGTAAHRRDAYLRLAEGWAPRPEGWWSDLWMWRKWLREDWVRTDAVLRVTKLRLGREKREGWPPYARMHESAHWYFRSRAPGFDRWLDEKFQAFMAGRGATPSA